MAVLNASQRLQAYVEWVRDICFRRSAVYGTKDQMRAVVDAVDTWVDDNQASYNSALPLPFRTSASAQEKSEVLMFVIRKRFKENV